MASDSRAVSSAADPVQGAGALEGVRWLPNRPKAASAAQEVSGGYIHIAVGGDVYPGTASGPYLTNGDCAAVFGDLLNCLAACDLRLCNLEGPVAEERAVVEKVGPVHRIDPGCVRGLKAAGFDLVNLANNHVMDLGLAGLRSTTKTCELQGLRHLGAGDDPVNASRPVTVQVRGVRVGVLAYAEHEFGCATQTEGGVNPLDLIQFVRTVERERANWDYLIVLLHAGNEYYPYPRPNLRELCRFMVERGAGAVICQHSHCPGCYERHGEGHIVYGQGNLLFDARRERECEQEGFLVVLRISHSGSSEMGVLPFALPWPGAGPRAMDGEREREFMRELRERSEAILRPGFVGEEWARFCRAKSKNYLALLHGYGRRIRELDGKLGFLRFFYSRRRLLLLLHLVRCESHREAIIDVLEKAIEEGV